MTDIREAAYIGDISRLKVFLDVQGIDVNEPHAINEMTALHWAVSGGHLDAVQYLISRGGDLSIKAKDKTPAMFAKTLEMKNFFHLPLEQTNPVTAQAPLSGSKPIFYPKVDLNVDSLKEREEKKQISPTTYLSKSTAIEENRTDQHKERFTEQNPTKFKTSSPTSNHPHFDLSFHPNFLRDPVWVSEEGCVRATLDGELFYEIFYWHKSFQGLCAALDEEFKFENLGKIRLIKLPNTVVRNDRDVIRLRHGEEIKIQILYSSKFIARHRNKL